MWQCPRDENSSTMHCNQAIATKFRSFLCICSVSQLITVHVKITVEIKFFQGDIESKENTPTTLNISHKTILRFDLECCSIVVS